MSDVMQVGDNVWSVIDGQRQYEVYVEPLEGAWSVSMRGRTQKVLLEDSRDEAAAANGRSGAGVARVASPMPGKVVRMLVAVGDEVAEGAGLAVVEAMKMQNELKSPIAGKVTQASAQAGETVQAGQVLAVVEAHAG